jgi:hypothetical protein
LSSEELIWETKDWLPLKKSVCCAGVVLWVKTSMQPFLPHHLCGKNAAWVWNELRKRGAFGKQHGRKSETPSEKYVSLYLDELTGSGFYEKVGSPEPRGAGFSQPLMPSTKAISFAKGLRVIDKDQARSAYAASFIPEKVQPLLGTLTSRIFANELIRPSERAKFFLEKAKHQYLCVDDAVLLFHTPAFRGFGPRDIIVKLDENANPLRLGSLALDNLVSKYGKIQPFEENRKNYFVSDYRSALLDQGDRWEITLGPSDYATNRSIEKALDNPVAIGRRRTTLRKAYQKGTLDFDRHLNNMIVVYLFVVSETDRLAVLTKRSRYVSYYPSCWYASVAEQMLRPTDSDFFDTATRLLDEELGIPNANREWISFLGVSRAFSNFNTIVMGTASLPLSAEQIEQAWFSAKDKEESVALDFRNLDLPTMIRILLNETYTPLTKNAEPFILHPLARMNLLLSLFGMYGYSKVVSGIHDYGAIDSSVSPDQ